jgi:nucleotide-binding universal stress UspA family protein
MTVLVGLVPGPEGAAAVAAGIQEARLRGSRLVVVNANRADRPIDPKVVSDADVAALWQQLKDSGLSVEVTQPLGHGNVSETLVRAAEEVQASLIVIGIRRRTPVGKFLLGSNASEILLAADCPVLAVKANHHSRAKESEPAQ